MADRIFFVGGSPEDFTRGVILPGEMVEDLLKIAGLSPDTVGRLRAPLQSADGFLDSARLDQLIRQEIHEESVAEAIASAVRNLSPSNVEQTLEKLRRWRQADPRRTDQLPDASLAELESNLPRLIRDFPAPSAMRKHSV